MMFCCPVSCIHKVYFFGLIIKTYFEADALMKFRFFLRLFCTEKALWGGRIVGILLFFSAYFSRKRFPEADGDDEILPFSPPFLHGKGS